PVAQSAERKMIPGPQARHGIDQVAAAREHAWARKLDERGLARSAVDPSYPSGDLDARLENQRREFLALPGRLERMSPADAVRERRLDLVEDVVELVEAPRDEELRLRPRHVVVHVDAGARQRKLPDIRQSAEIPFTHGREQSCTVKPIVGGSAHQTVFGG